MQGEVQLLQGNVNGYNSVEGEVTYRRDSYGHTLAVEVATSNRGVVTVPWRNVAVVVTESSERGETADASG